MYDSPIRGMYLRPGNLYKEFRLLTEKTEISDTGTPIKHFVDSGRIFRGILAQVGTDEAQRMKHLWDADQHNLTHTIVSRGKSMCKKGDMLAGDNQLFFVLLVQEVGQLGITTIYYVEERNDVK